MNAEAARLFAESWVDAWNRRDLEAVLSHMAEDVAFTSPRAAAVCGRAVVQGKEALRAYWSGALQAISSLQFRLDHVVAGERRVAIVYVAEINGVARRAVELYEFDAEGRVVRGEAMYGAEVDAG